MKTDSYVKLFNEVSPQNRKDLGESICILCRFFQERFPVSNGFVLTPQCLEIQTEEIGMKKGLVKEKFQIFKEIEITRDAIREIKECYKKISGFSEAYVTLRALILDKQGDEVKHGEYVLSQVRGESELISGIAGLYNRILNENYKHREKFIQKDLNITICVQKTQPIEVSGVLYTTDLISGDENHLTIEAVFGLGLKLDGTPLVPDQYIINKDNAAIIEKYISTQEFMLVHQGVKNNSDTEKVEISSGWRKKQKLPDKHIAFLSRIGIIIEKEIDHPLEIIWSYESGKIWINFIENLNKLTLEKNASSLQERVDETVIEFKHIAVLKDEKTVLNLSDLQSKLQTK